VLCFRYTNAERCQLERNVTDPVCRGGFIHLTWKEADTSKYRRCFSSQHTTPGIFDRWLGLKSYADDLRAPRRMRTESSSTSHMRLAVRIGRQCVPTSLTSCWKPSRWRAVALGWPRRMANW
jgi:hypothetical protein